MSLHTPIRSAVLAAALAVPLLSALPATAAPCQGGSQLSCSPRHEGSSGGGGGPTGGGGGGGGGEPAAPPPPEGLTPDEGVGFVPAPGGNAPIVAQQPNPADTAAQALTERGLPVPKVATAPKGKTFVRVRTTLLVKGIATVSTEPVGAGGPVVQATAVPTSITWTLGDGKTLDCAFQQAGDGAKCDYAYQRSSAAQRGNSYKVIAKIIWKASWRCVAGGPCGGALPDMFSESPPTPLVVGEIQTNARQ